METAWPHKDKAPEFTQSHYCHILLGKIGHKASSDSKGLRRKFYIWLGDMSMPHYKELYILELEVFVAIK